MTQDSLTKIEQSSLTNKTEVLTMMNHKEEEGHSKTLALMINKDHTVSKDKSNLNLTNEKAMMKESSKKSSISFRPDMMNLIRIMKAERQVKEWILWTGKRYLSTTCASTRMRLMITDKNCKTSLNPRTGWIAATRVMMVKVTP